MKLVKENISDVLRPKNLSEKLFYVSSNFLSYPAMIVRIKNVGSTEAQQYGEPYNIAQFQCEVVTNEKMIEGADFYSLDPGSTFTIDEEDFKYYEFKELDDEVIAVMDQEIEKLDMKKKYIENLINES